MKLRKTSLLVALILGVASVFAENNYKVTSSSRLNVRKSPSASAAVLGTFKSGQEIEVISINKGWAKVKFNGRAGYVRDKYVAPLPKKETPKTIPVPQKEVVPERVVADNRTTDNHNSSYHAGSVDDFEVETPLTIGSFMPDDINLYLAVQGGLGYSNFTWDAGNVNGTLSYSVDVAAQLYFKRPMSFIPQNWYSELSLGYDKRGAASYGLNCFHARVYPLGYRIPLSPISMVVKGGVTLAYPFEDLDGIWSTDFQVGVGGGLSVEWKQFSVGCNVEYDFTQVSSACNQTLNNIAILGTISYKFAKFGHK